jgi:hypothetical protein
MVVAVAAVMDWMDSRLLLVLLRRSRTSLALSTGLWLAGRDSCVGTTLEILGRSVRRVMRCEYERRETGEAAWRMHVLCWSITKILAKLNRPTTVSTIINIPEIS